MNDTPLLLKELSRRAIPAVACFGMGTAVLLFTLKMESAGFMAACAALFGLGFLVAGSILVAPAIARIIAQPSGNIFYPVERFSKPQPVYSIPRSRRLESKPKEALEGYRLIIEEHPQERPAYIEMIDIAARDLKDDALAEKILKQGMDNLKDESDRKVLLHKYNELMQRVDAPCTYKASP